MLIVTEKPSVAKDFATALSCKYDNGIYHNNNFQIVHCVGHLFKLYEPQQYNEQYKAWDKLPVIPSKFKYYINPDVLTPANIVIHTLKEHSNDEILIATDADREGEIIARECLEYAGIKNYSKIKRFWVSQALTPDVIKEGIKNAKPLEKYNELASQGFARQHADWLVGINFTRYISVAAHKKLPVGRVQTAVLSAIKNRCHQIETFVSKKYYEFTGFFQDEIQIIKGTYITDIGSTKFGTIEKLDILKNNIGSKVQLVNKKSEQKVEKAPLLFNLNEIQKEAFRLFGYTAEYTLSLVQRLYEEYKCVSYPRTPSRVMGEKNVELCQRIFSKLTENKDEYNKLSKLANVSASNKQVFDDSKLEAHHALIPLAELPGNATEPEKNVYSLIHDRFLICFLSSYKYNKIIYTLKVKNDLYQVIGRDVIEYGWKEFSKKEQNKNEEEQELKNVNWDALKLINVTAEEKWTKPPKHYNEASILSFMENPKDIENNMKLVGLGTPATRHTYIPKLLENEYITVNKKNIEITQLGIDFLSAVENSSICRTADINETTNWEQQLNDDPEKFIYTLTEYVKKAVSAKININIKTGSEIICPLCQKEIRKGKNNWYCSNYKSGCKFNIWESVSGSKITESDVKKLTAGELTGKKKCISKAGKNFECKFKYNTSENKLEFVFDN